MEEAIEQLAQDAEFLYSSRIVVALLYNVLGDPLNEKYRRLRVGAKVSYCAREGGGGGHSAARKHAPSLHGHIK